MPIGVPRIIYCWGEETPAQWTDIYNFIFRRRMVFLMQYLDDELCNQICGLLINIHMEDRSKELEKKEMEKSGLFKTPPKQKKGENAASGGSPSSMLSRGSGSSPAFNMANARPQKLIEDLMISEQDLGIDENYSLERYTLQKMTLEWLNWNAQFFDYSEEPYLFYLAEILSKDFSGKGSEGRLYYEDFNTSGSFETVDQNDENSNSEKFGKEPSFTLNASLPFEFSRLMTLFKNVNISNGQLNSSTGLNTNKTSDKVGKFAPNESRNFEPKLFDVQSETLSPFDVYSPFRLLANLVSPKYREFFPSINKTDVFQSNKDSESNSESALPFPIAPYASSIPYFDAGIGNKTTEENTRQNNSVFGNTVKNGVSSFPFFQRGTLTPNQDFEKNQRGSHLNSVSHLIKDLSTKNLFEGLSQSPMQLKFSEKALAQKQLRGEYKKTSLNIFPPSYSKRVSYEKTQFSNRKSRTNYSASQKRRSSVKPASYLAGGSLPSEESYMEFRDYYRKQTESALQEEEAKKVFMIINSFGGSVGNGITVHDALQFIKAGSLTLALGVAASAASLALAGGTIGERYVTEGCHTMIHQPEGGLQGQASDIWIDSQEILSIRLTVAEIYSLSTYRPKHKILRDLDRDFYLTAQETVMYGLADEIASNEVMHEIISMTSQVWDVHDIQQQKLLERRESANAATDTQTQN